MRAWAQNQRSKTLLSNSFSLPIYWSLAPRHRRDSYLGPYGTKASKIEYDRLISEWLAAGRPARLVGSFETITITELCASFWKHAKSYYLKNGKPTGTAESFKPVIRLLRQSYGCTRACEFGPLSLKSLRCKMIDLGHSRRYINDNVERVKRIFNWGVSEELVDSTVHQALK